MTPYRNRFDCSRCRKSFDSGGFILNLHSGGNAVIIPICQSCLDAGELYEGVVNLGVESLSPPLGLA